MKSQIEIIILLIFLVFSTATAQHRDSPPKQKESESTSKINNVNREVNDANESIKNSNKTVENTVETLEDTWTTVKDVFKSKKSKNDVTIIISPILYDNEHLNSLYNHISNSSKVKKSTKSFNDNIILISLVCKTSADDIWQDVPKNIRANFKIIEIGEKNIILNPLKLAQENK